MSFDSSGSHGVMMGQQAVLDGGQFAAGIPLQVENWWAVSSLPGSYNGSGEPSELYVEETPNYSQAEDSDVMNEINNMTSQEINRLLSFTTSELRDVDWITSEADHRLLMTSRTEGGTGGGRSAPTSWVSGSVVWVSSSSNPEPQMIPD